MLRVGVWVRVRASAGREETEAADNLGGGRRGQETQRGRGSRGGSMPPRGPQPPATQRVRKSQTLSFSDADFFVFFFLFHYVLLIVL